MFSARQGYRHARWKTSSWLLLLCATHLSVAAPLPRQLPLLEGGASWLPSWRHWPGTRQEQELRTIIVTPLLPNGTRAAPAELQLPDHQIAREHLRREPPPPPVFHQSMSPDIPWYSYNSSDATPLIPVPLAWMTDVERMEDRALEGGLDISVARKLSELVAATYCNSTNLKAWNCTRCGPGFQVRKAIFDPGWDLQAFVGWSDELNAVVVAFRGTDSHSYYNWAENMRTWRTDLALTYDGIPPHALVHGGFFYSYNSSYLAGNVSRAVGELVQEHVNKAAGSGGGGAGGGWKLDAEGVIAQRSNWMSERQKQLQEESLLLQSVGNDDAGKDEDDSAAAAAAEKLVLAPTIFVTGHSLGGALATLAALDLRITLGLPDVRVVSFGSPRVGNAVFAEWFAETVGPHWRFTHNRDIVPSLPPVYMGFRHVAEEIWVVDNLLNGHTLVGVCDGSGEDPRCHASLCHLGLCSSLADHLLYLSQMYSPHPYGC